MFKKTILAIILIFVITLSTMPLMAAETSNNQSANQNGASVLSDFVTLTSDLSKFFGNSMSFMKEAIGYLTGGISAAEQFQSGTNLVNDMLQNGPPKPKPVAAASSSAPQIGTVEPTTDTEVAQEPSETTTAPVDVSNVDNAQFTNFLSSYKELAQEELKLTETLAQHNDPALKEVLNDVKKAKDINKNKILFSISQDMETKKYDKLHLLVDYVNTQGEETTKIFFEVIDETKMKLQFSLIQAQNMGISVDIEMIEGKLALIFKLTTGSTE